MQLTVNEHIIHYQLLNKQLADTKKPVLIFLHDGLGSIAQWKDIPQKICNAVNLSGIIYDRIDYGISSERKLGLNANYLHDEALIYLPGLLSALEIRNKIILIGHSDGGSIALLYAGFFSDQLLGVISESAHVFVEEITCNGIQQLKTDYHSYPYLMKSLKRYHGDHTHQLFTNWTDLWLSDELRKWNIESELKNINVPVLAIQGTEDEFGSISQLDAIKNNADAEVSIHLLPDCGHFPHFEKEGIVLGLIKDFINHIIIE